MDFEYTKLNVGWNAEPNAPEPSIEVDGSTVRVTFLANAFQFPEYDEEDRLQIEFRSCSKYRLGPTNDEGWAMGQCRFGRTIPWGEFYELRGNLLLDAVDGWIQTSQSNISPSHYLFYFRDETFECDAESWKLRKL